MHMKFVFLGSGKVAKISNLHGLKNRNGKSNTVMDLVCSWRCTTNSFTNAPFTMVIYGENTFQAAGGFSVAVLPLATGTNWQKG